MRDLLIVSKKWSQNRGSFTSIERFCSILDPEFNNYHGKRTSLPPVVSKAFKKWTNSRVSEFYSAPYNSWSFELELWGLIQAIRSRYRFVFFPYADYDYFYWQHFKKLLGTKIILWTYFSEKELAQRFRDLSHFEKADLVLVAGQAQLEYILDHAPRSKVKYFPIGVDTEFFKPSSDYEPFRLVHVGHNRRDFTTLITALDMVYKENPNLRVDLLGASTSKTLIPLRPYLTLHGQLEDEAFQKVIRSCNFAILSLEDGGSSNSLLETCSCGLPVVVTKLHNIRDYMDESFTLSFKKGDATALKNHCMYLLENHELRQSMSVAAREHAMKYDWNVLKPRFLQLLHSL